FWLFWWLGRLLGSDRQAGEFDDIEQALTAATAELGRAGIGLTDVPVFLVLGRPAGGLEAFFAATRLPFQVRPAPTRQAPLHPYANRDAVFVSCGGASLLPVQAARLSRRGNGEGGRENEERGVAQAVGPVDLLASVGAELEPAATPTEEPAPS